MIKRIRDKFRAIDPAFDEIESYTGFGYCCEEPDEVGPWRGICEGSCRCHSLDLSFGGQMESREDCLREASECDRLANLANTRATRALLALSAFQWRKLAVKPPNGKRPVGRWCRKRCVRTSAGRTSSTTSVNARAGKSVCSSEHIVGVANRSTDQRRTRRNLGENPCGRIKGAPRPCASWPLLVIQMDVSSA